MLRKRRMWHKIYREFYKNDYQNLEALIDKDQFEL